MQLRQPEPLGVENRHHRRIRHVHPDFHDGRGYDRVEVAGPELLHHVVAPLAIHLAVDHPHIETSQFALRQRGKDLLRSRPPIRDLSRINERTNHVKLPPLTKPLPDELPRLSPCL